MIFAKYLPIIISLLAHQRDKNATLSMSKFAILSTSKSATLLTSKSATLSRSRSARLSTKRFARLPSQLMVEDPEEPPTDTDLLPLLEETTVSQRLPPVVKCLARSAGTFPARSATMFPDR